MPLFKRSPPPSPDALLRQQLQPHLARLATAEGDDQVPALAALVRALRPRRRERQQPAARLQALAGLLRAQPESRSKLRAALMWLLAEKQAIHLFSDAGILSSVDFSTAFSRRISQRLLPDVINTDHLKDVFSLIFHHEEDYLWLRAAGHEAWLDLVNALDFETGHAAEKRKLGQQIVAAMEVLSYRITSIGLEPELVRNHAAIERHESPFLTQNAEMRAFVDEWRRAVTDKREHAIDGKQIDVLMTQCTEIIAKIRKQAAKTGASVSLTTLLVRLEQSIDRFAELMCLLEAPPALRNEQAVTLFLALVEANNRRNSVRDLFRQTSELLAKRITGHAGKTGEAYITNNRGEYFGLFRAAIGAGFLVALMAFAKISMSHGEYAPFVEALRYSALYAGGFVLMSICHWALATKQPAMTANRIAQSMDPREGKDRLEGLAEIIVRTLRSQFVALFGNFAMVIPLPIVLSIAYLMQTADPYVTPEKADYLLHQIDPLAWTTWLWAAITGLWLFLSGLISGYYDNRAAYDRIPQRLAQLRGLRRLLGARLTQRFAGWVEANLGAIAGSFYFGIMLGSTGALGKILGLPLDTLHVTFSTANTVYAAMGLAEPLAAIDWARAATGIAVIGALNLGVSFSLALVVAMRAQGVEFDQTGRLLRLLLGQLLRAPQRFIWPPPDPRPDPEAPAAAKSQPTRTDAKTEARAEPKPDAGGSAGTPPPG
jgi:site-specific recombinase